MGFKEYSGEPLYVAIMQVLLETKEEYQRLLNVETDTVKIFRVQGAIKAIDDLQYIMTEDYIEEE